MQGNKGQAVELFATLLLIGLIAVVLAGAYYWSTGKQLPVAGGGLGNITGNQTLNGSMASTTILGENTTAGNNVTLIINISTQ